MEPVYPLLYHGPLNYFARLVTRQKICLERHDHYNKQSYRNRCRIMGPNGLQVLSIPVKKIHGQKQLFKDVRIDYDVPWLRIHWLSLKAGYANSPYFELLADELHPVYNRNHAFLVDLNLEMLELVLGIMGLKPTLQLSESFAAVSGPEDPREFIHAKKNLVVDPGFQSHHYHQVFADRHGFMPNLSILDALFNLGPECLPLLRLSLSSEGQG